ncbi:MAG: Rne/Rng family ribonuclease [Bacteroidetes bacterium]|nr:Rne/Rng family ribonuclease [Bacteroidota bacterium]
MSNELIIQKSSAGVEIALLSNRKLIEFHRESSSEGFQVGDFYLGKVKKISPSLNAAFIHVGGEKDGFLTYFDLGPNLKSLRKVVKSAIAGNPRSGNLDQFSIEDPIVKTGKIGNVLKVGEPLLVQVIKEPIANKGPKISCDISIPGRYFILVPFNNTISISRKIGNPKEKSRLKDLADSIRPHNFGVIIRTVSEGVALEELDKDMRELVKKWDALIQALKNAATSTKVLGEGNRLQTLLRDILNDSFTQIISNDPEIYASVKETLTKYNADSDKIVKLHQGKIGLFDQFNVNRQIQSSFGRNVPFSGGAYLVIDHTEALHVVDVNSGSTSYDQQNREANVLKINLEAVEEIARQVRLRDMGGIIVIDFIDMRDPKKKNELFQTLKTAMKTDRARHNILPMSKFGLVQITRERVRPATEIATQEVCISCNGTGKMDSSIQLIDKIENEINYLWENMNQKHVTLRANPLIINYFRHGIPSLRMKWWLKHKHWLKLQADPSLSLTAYQLVNELKQVVNQEA